MLLARQRGLSVTTRVPKRRCTTDGGDELNITTKVAADLVCADLPSKAPHALVRRTGPVFTVGAAALTDAHRRSLTLRPKESSVALGPTPSYPLFRECSHATGQIQIPRFYAQACFALADTTAPPPRPAGGAPLTFEGTLTTRQRDILTHAMRSLHTHHGAMLVLPCGTGKTVLAIRILCELGQKTMVLVHTQCLMDQWKVRIAQFCPAAKVGSLQGNRVRVVGKGINHVTREDLRLTGLFDEEADQASGRVPPTVGALKARLKELGVRRSGKRDELVSRLRAYDTAHGTAHEPSLHTAKMRAIDRVLAGIPYTSDAPLDSQFVARGIRPKMAADLAALYDGRDYDVVIAMIQSVCKKTYHSSLLRYGLLVVDEAHHVCARMMSESMFRIDARCVLGLSATPKRTDALGYALPWLLGPVAYALKAQYPDAYYHPIEYLPEDPSKRTEIMGRHGKLLVPHMITRLVQDDVRNLRITDTLMSALWNGRHVIVISERLGHLDILETMLMTRIHIDATTRTVYVPTSGSETAFARAFADPSVSDAHVADFVAFVRSADVGVDERWTWVHCPRRSAITVGQFRGGMDPATRCASVRCQVVLTTYQMCSEGLDIPRLDTLIFATPRSNIEQSAGRILRSHPDKQSPVVHDLVDKYSLFEKMYWKRLRVYRSMAFTRCDGD